MKKNILNILVLIFTIIMLALSIQGNPGNPTEKMLGSSEYKENGPFELSPERGKFSLLYSIVENKTVYFSEPVARFTMPDLAVNKDGKYVSLFPPGISYLIIPGYIIGKYFNFAEIGVIAFISLFAFLNVLLIKAIAQRLGAGSVSATLAGLIFLFATPAFTYAVSLYQHHVSTFIILASLYLLLRWPKKIPALFTVWLLISAGIVVDNPNFFLLIPVGIYALLQSFKLIQTHHSAHSNNTILSVNILRLVTVFAAVIPVAFLLYYNINANGNAFQLSGTLPSAKIENPSSTSTLNDNNTESSKEPEKSAIGFFKTRRMLNGAYILLFSPDRGVIYFTPIILFGIFGMIVINRKKGSFSSLLIGIIGINLLLYAMWGDPWGGWAFGSRYLIPSYALLSILIAIGLNKIKKNKALLIIFILALIYSISVNSLGALTSHKNPPQVEILALEKQTGKVEKYTYERNWDYLRGSGTRSYVYNYHLKNYLSPQAYYYLVLSILTIVSISLLVTKSKSSSTTIKSNKSN